MSACSRTVRIILSDQKKDNIRVMAKICSHYKSQDNSNVRADHQRSCQDFISRAMLCTWRVNMLDATSFPFYSKHAQQPICSRLKHRHSKKERKTLQRNNETETCDHSEQRKVGGQLSISWSKLTSILLSSDPALLRLPRLPAQNM